MHHEIPAVENWDELVALVSANDPVFLRFSEGPDADQRAPRSRDYQAGVTLPGLSVTTIGPEPWWPRAVDDWVARRLCKYAELGAEDRRFPWLLTGHIVGRGPDHEPLLTDWHPVAIVETNLVKQARARYEHNFDVGSDSRQDS